MTDDSPEVTETPTTPPEPAPALASVRPESLPDKFWDADANTVRTDALIKSYNALEQRLGEGLPAIPDTPDAYDISPPEGFEEILASDPDVNARLHEAGFSNEQAALVYQLAGERLLPMVQHLAADMNHSRETADIVRQVGGEEKWRALKPQIESWGRGHLSPAAFGALSATAAGVMAMRRMMTHDEPAVLNGGGGSSPALSESELKRMMQDPRYWRDEDPVYIAQVQAGFEALYPN